MRQAIDTTRVADSANRLRIVNNNIERHFQSFRNSAGQLNNTWHSRAGDKAKTEMYKLFDGATARSTVLQNYITILNQQINPGYNDAEAVNTSLADQFK